MTTSAAIDAPSADTLPWEPIVDQQLLRLRLPLSLGIDHVNAYAARDDHGHWLLVDCGIGSDSTLEIWRHALDVLDAPVRAIVVTHSHPDHVGAAAALSRLTGAQVFQSEADGAMARFAWEGDAALAELPDRLVALGVPIDCVRAASAHQQRIRSFIELAPPSSTGLLGDAIGGWSVCALPGHAPGQIGLFRDGILLGGDAILERITPHVSLDLYATDNPLRDFLASLDFIASLGAIMVAPGHFGAIGDPAARVREIVEHHERRLAQLAAIVRASPSASPFELSRQLFDAYDDAPSQLFALFETLAHLVYLQGSGVLE